MNHPRDPGGATNKGITLATFRRYVKKGGTVSDLRNITDEQVAKVYRKHYWDAVSGDDLPAGLDYAMFDFGVNSGPSRAIKFLQWALAVPQDGKLGPVTMAAVAKDHTGPLIEVLCDRRLAWLKGLGTWPTFGNGWTNRVVGVKSLALKMSPLTPPPIPDKHTEPPEEVVKPDLPPPAESGGFFMKLLRALWAAIKGEN